LINLHYSKSIDLDLWQEFELMRIAGIAEWRDSLAGDRIEAMNSADLAAEQAKATGLSLETTNIDWTKPAVLGCITKLSEYSPNNCHSMKQIYLELELQNITDSSQCLSDKRFTLFYRSKSHGRIARLNGASLFLKRPITVEAYESVGVSLVFDTLFPVDRPMLECARELVEDISEILIQDHVFNTITVVKPILLSGRLTDWKLGDLVILKLDSVGCLLEGIGCTGQIVELTALESIRMNSAGLARRDESWKARSYPERKHTRWFYTEREYPSSLDSHLFERYSAAKHEQLLERIRIHNAEIAALGDDYDP
jgi:hypothetical protein